MIKKLIKVKENYLSENIIVPLLEKMYSCRVAFVGGRNEKGRDIIIYTQDKFLSDEYIGIQVKRTPLTSNSQSNSIMQALTQIDQMNYESTTDPHHAKKIQIKKKVLITPYEISEETRDSHQGAISQFSDKNVNIIDGKQLLELIRAYHPDLLDLIDNKQNNLLENIQSSLTNKALLMALDFSNVRDLGDIYCESVFSSGNVNHSSPCKFNFHKSTNLVNIKISPHTYDIINTSNKLLKENLGIEIVETEELITAAKLIEDYNAAKKKTENLSYRIGALTSDIIKYTEEFNLSKYIKQTKATIFENIKSFVEQDCENIEPIESKVEFFEAIVELKKQIDKRRVIYNENIKLQEFVNSCENNTVFDEKELTKNGYSPNINLHLKDVYKAHNEKIDSFYESSKTKKCNLKKYLLTSNKVEKNQRALLSLNQLLKALPDKKFEITKVDNVTKHKEKDNIAVFDVFNTGLNILVLGEAGSGKSTNLQYYAKTLYDNDVNYLVIFSTLSKLATKINNETNKDLSKAIYKFMAENRTSMSFDDFENNIRNEKSLFILDSIDEAIVSYPWILDSLSTFSIRFPKAQIITSSRFSVENLQTLDFNVISLLEFDDIKKDSFFKKWFNNDVENVTKILEHLKNNPRLNKVVCNPLSATIMATLQEQNVPLPLSESSLYKARFELLSGVFDKYKDVHRMKVPPEKILTAAREIAFMMHKSGDRTASKSNIIRMITQKNKILGNVDILVDELIFPAEILLPHIEGGYDFGHLKFQEYLASEHLIHIRSIRAIELVKKKWWHEALILYAQHSFEIDWIITEICDLGYATKHQNILRKLISQRSNEEIEQLLRKLEFAISDEKENSI